MSDEFDLFWAAYPRREGKGSARKAFAKALTKTTLTVMLTALTWQRSKPQWLKSGGMFIPLPATWLNQERWDDEPASLPELSGKTIQTLEAIYGRRH